MVAFDRGHSLCDADGQGREALFDSREVVSGQEAAGVGQTEGTVSRHGETRTCPDKCTHFRRFLSVSPFVALQKA